MDTSFHEQRSRRWTCKEAAILKNGFRQGKGLKQIAREMGRTETAVNKFLSRSGIRGRCRAPYRRPCLPPAEKTKKFAISPETLHRVYKNEQQADLTDVVLYLKSHGHVISRLIPRRYKILNIPADFIVDGKPVSKGCLVLQANKLRLTEKQPIFSIPSVIW
jgi:hypothetical protein